MRTLLIIAALALLAAGTQAEAGERGTPPAGSVHYEFREPGRLHLVVESTHDGGAAQSTRSGADSDRDGHVNRSEVEAWRQAALDSVARVDRGFGAPVGRVLVDGQSDNRSRVESLRAEGLEGQTDSSDALHLRWRIALGFEVQAAAEHLVTLDLGNQSVGASFTVTVDSARVTAPPGYRIAETGYVPRSASVDESERHLFLPDGLQPAKVQMEILLVQDDAAIDPDTSPLPAGDRKEAPLAAWMVAAAGMLAMAAGRRRR